MCHCPVRFPRQSRSEKLQSRLPGRRQNSKRQAGLGLHFQGHPASVANSFIRNAFHAGQRVRRVFPAKLEVSAAFQRRIDSHRPLADRPPPARRRRPVQGHQRRAERRRHVHHPGIDAHHQTRLSQQGCRFRKADARGISNKMARRAPHALDDGFIGAAVGRRAGENHFELAPGGFLNQRAPALDGPLLQMLPASSRPEMKHRVVARETRPAKEP